MSELTRQVVMSARSGLTARKSTRVETNLWGALALAIVTLRLLEVSWRGSLLLSLVLAILTAFGTAIVNQLLGKNLGIGASVVVASSVFVFAGQLLLVSGLNRFFAHWLPIAAMSVFVVWWHSGSRVSRIENDVSRVLEFQFVLSIGIAALSLSHTWLIPYALALACWVQVQRRAELQLVGRILVAACLCAGWLSSLLLRPDRWWYFYQGRLSQFYEAVSWSIGWWGVLDHPGQAGSKITNYHWFSYAFFGALSSIAELAPWDALMKLGVVLIPTLFASIFILKPGHVPSWFSLKWMVLVIATTAMEISRTDSLVFSIVVAFVLLAVVRECADDRFSWRHLLVLTPLSTMLVLTKVSTAVVIGAVLALFLAVQVIRREKAVWQPALVLFAAFLVIYFCFMRDNEPEMLTRFKLDPIWSLNELSDLLETRSLLNAVLWITIAFLLTGTQVSKRAATLDFSILVVSIVAPILYVVLAGPHSRYFGLPGIWLITLLVLWRLNDFASESKIESHTGRVWQVTCFILVSAFVGFYAPKVLRRIDDRLVFDSEVRPFLSGLLTSSGITLGILLMSPVVFLLLKRRTAAILLLAATLGVFAGQSAEYFSKLRFWGAGIYESSNTVQATFAKPDLQEVAAYIRQNTKESVILASNQFCCFGEIWQISGHSDREFIHVSVIDRLTDSRWGGSNYLLPAYTRRRFLVQGLRFQLYTGSQSLIGEPLEKLRLSLEFANRPSLSSLDGLKSFGVSGFVVNLTLTEERDWTPFARSVFQVGEFVYLELK